MITALFKVTGQGSYKGFSVSGHSGHSRSGTDIVCAAVSSSVMLVINLCVDYFEVDGSTEVIDDTATVSFTVNKPSKDADMLIKGLKEHLEALSEEYPDNVAVVTE